MSDSNVLAAQKYLNAMYGGNPNWVQIKEDGSTGTKVMEGIIRAFQIQNNVSSVTGTVGPLTISKMKSLPVIGKMDPNGQTDNNVCLIQCALFCKGYNAGGITGIYYNAGVAAVSEMQEDAGIAVTGKVDWKVWSGLLSMNWFTKVSGGDSTTQLIQRQLNSDWSDIIGVGPCDGVVSRQTALSLVGALQGAEGVTTELITDLNEVNFGDATTAAFPKEGLKVGQDSGNYIKFNKIAQYGLYFNGYNPGRFDGVYDSKMQSQVEKFQKFYGLTGIGLVTAGEVNVSTMKSLLTSKGDVARRAFACDCSTVLNAQQALSLKNAGYTHVGRYLTGSVGTAYIPKFLTLDEIKNIKNAGLNVFLIYQDGGYELDYFKDPTHGSVDAQTATLAAERIGAPKGSIIYFAVDFDCYGYEIESFIIPYFRKIFLFFNSSYNEKNYKAGVYAPRYVCSRLSDEGLVSSSFVADMSTGFSCNLGYPIPDNWAFDQFHEEDFTSQPTFPIDKDAYSGRDTGVSKFEEVPKKSDEEIAKENQAAKVKIARNQFIYNVLEPLGYLTKAMDIGVKYDVEIPLDTIESPEGTVQLTATYSTEVKKPAENDYNISVGIDNSGNLTAGCQDQISSISTELKKGTFKGADKFGDVLTNIALSVKSGNITFEEKCIPPLEAEFSITVSTDDLFPEGDKISAAISVKLTFKITLNDDSDNKFNAEAFENIGIGIAIAVAAVAIVALAPEELIVAIVGALGELVGEIGNLFEPA